MSAVIDVKKPVEIQKVGIRALNDALGPEGARVFMRRSFGGCGDFTKEKYEMPEESMEEIAEDLWRIDAEELARRGLV
jgi:hypothetical protein